MLNLKQFVKNRLITPKQQLDFALFIFKNPLLFVQYYTPWNHMIPTKKMPNHWIAAPHEVNSVCVRHAHFEMLSVFHAAISAWPVLRLEGLPSFQVECNEYRHGCCKEEVGHVRNAEVVDWPHWSNYRTPSWDPMQVHLYWNLRIDHFQKFFDVIKTGVPMEPIDMSLHSVTDHHLKLVRKSII